MKQYKKVIIALLMAFVMAFVFTACGENNSKAVGSNESSSVSKEDTSSKVEKEKDKTDKDSSDKKTENKDDKQNTSKEDTSKKQDTQQTDNSQSNSVKSSSNQTATQSNQTSNNNQQSNSSQNTQTQTPTPQPTPTPTPEPEPEPEKQCYLTIECKTILNNMSNLTPGKESLVPADGYILYKTAVTFKDGENVFDVLLRETRARGIHMEHEYTPGFGSEYIEGINNLYEFDCGSGSGWMYYVNGSKPNYGVSKYTVQEGDNIEFRYTCDLGWDL